jgi:hypothetical protein
MLRLAVLRSRPGVDRLPVALNVRNDNLQANLVTLIASCDRWICTTRSPSSPSCCHEED